MKVMISQGTEFEKIKIQSDHGVAGTGRITTEWTVWCGRCAVWETNDVIHGKKSEFIAGIRNSGWKRTKSDGWVCPDCLGG